MIEQIYAGPQGSFVPKTWSTARRFSFLTDLGFIVVQMDGMGTANRSKAFHDVCWHDLKDAGFPDRILWHQAVAKKYPSYDLDRVGIYGTSAGGQNATGGVLFHPEFYKVAASACGCHDNRMDKASWNEQWMGYPVGPWYSASSNIDNAHRLQGKLLLIVGEMDTNVPPESTMRLVDALIKANKDFDLVVVPGANHGMGGAYGQRRLRDFFVRHLQGGELRKSAPCTAREVDRELCRRPATAAESNAERRPARILERFARSGRDEQRAQRASRGDRALRRPTGAACSDRCRLRLRPGATSGSRIHQAVARPARQPRVRPLEPGRQGRLSAAARTSSRTSCARSTSAARRSPSRPRSFRSPAPILELDESRRELKPMDWSKVAGTLDQLDEADRRRTQRARARAARQGPGEAACRESCPGRRPRACGARSAAGSGSMTATTRSSRGGWKSRTRPPTRRSTPTPACSGSDIGAVATGFGEDLVRAQAGAGAAAVGRARPAEADPAGPGPRGPHRPDRRAGERDRRQPDRPRGALCELQSEMIAYTPEELIEIARKELAWCEDQMKQAAREMGKGDDWKAALEHVKTLYVEPGKQPGLIRDLALEAIDYMERNNLVTVPQLCRDSWRMEMMSPERQLVNPFFTGGEMISVSFPTNTMPHESKLMSLRGNNIHFSRATVFHEVIPGHHLQGYMTSRYKTYRRPFNTAVLGRGLGPLLGALALGQGLRQVAREPRRHALLAHAPLRAHHLLAGLPSRKDDAQGVHRLPGRSHRPRARQRDGRGAPLVHDVVRPALPGGLPAWRTPDPRPPSRAGRIGKDDRPQFPRRDSQGERHPDRDGPGSLDRFEAHARLEAGVEVLRRPRIGSRTDAPGASGRPSAARSASVQPIEPLGETR